jgi:hypothetical protein
MRPYHTAGLLAWANDRAGSAESSLIIEARLNPFKKKRASGPAGLIPFILVFFFILIFEQRVPF